MERPSTDGHGDDWELDPAEVNFQERIASGAFGDLFRGNYCGQDVAIKVLKNVQDDSQQYREFLQVRYPVESSGHEVMIMTMHADCKPYSHVWQSLVCM